MKKKVCGDNRTVGYFTGFGSVAQLAVVVFLIVEQTLCTHIIYAILSNMERHKLNRRITEKLENLLTRAKAQGLSQKELAARAGISEVGLSQAKARGDLRVSTLEALANALDMTIEFKPRHFRNAAIAAIREGQFFELAGEP
ncbi:helix-turn-helix domain-containing protein [Thiolapillus sp.]|uniref:helix-turn-helix domain-containing protein n=4 Tax=Thiolapillus sp. TaxID=2017437 RepID=UPI00352A6CE8